MVSHLLKQWGPEGFVQHVDKVRSFYQEQRDHMLKAAETHLKGNLLRHSDEAFPFIQNFRRSR
jgi:DNA-binding transcriptional MocR family regulator